MILPKKLDSTYGIYQEYVQLILTDWLIDNIDWLIDSTAANAKITGEPLCKTALVESTWHIILIAIRICYVLNIIHMDSTHNNLKNVWYGLFTFSAAAERKFATSIIHASGCLIVLSRVSEFVKKRFESCCQNLSVPNVQCQ